MGTNIQKFGLRFGALAPRISEQLADQGLKVGNVGNELLHVQNDADAVTRLAVRGYIPDHIKLRLHRKIMKAVREMIVGAV